MTANDWADIVTGSVTATAALFGVAAASIRFLLLPLGNNWHVGLGDLRIRKSAKGWAYLVTLSIENRSSATQQIRGWWRRVVFPDDVAADYDPNAFLSIYSDDDAGRHYGANSGVHSYPLPPGESYTDLILIERSGDPQQLCYIEYTLRYRRWGRKWLLIPWRDWEFMSQIMIAPVEIHDLVRAQTHGSL